MIKDIKKESLIILIFSLMIVSCNNDVSILNSNEENDSSNGASTLNLYRIIDDSRDCGSYIEVEVTDSIKFRDHINMMKKVNLGQYINDTIIEE